MKFSSTHQPKKEQVKTVEWVTKTGKKRRIRLYLAWKRMRGRCHGSLHDGRGNYRWKHLDWSFSSWKEFWEWSLKNGYSKQRCSLDRIDRTKGYSPENCRWLTRGDNTRLATSKKPIPTPSYLTD